MTSPYNMGYAQNGYPQAYPQSQGSHSSPSVFASAGVGMLGGGAAGYYFNRHPVKDGLVSDTFASEALNTFIDKGYATEDKSFYRKLIRLQSPKSSRNLLIKTLM